MTALRPTSAAQRPEDLEPAGAGRRIVTAVDLATLTALALFAVWTVGYLGALAGLVPSGVAFWGWLVCSPVVAVLAIRLLRPMLEAIPVCSPWAPLGVGALFAVGAGVIVRPDLDDASYVVRSTWIAAHGDVGVGDVIFSAGIWPGMGFQTPYLPSVEALFGWVARSTGISAGTVVYVLVPPVASFLGIWALGMLLRAWRARNVSASLVVAAVFLLFGGAAHASWGNLNLARIWQGKVLFLCIVVPVIYAILAAYWNAVDRRGRRAALAGLGLAGVAGVGLSPVAVFVVPGVIVVGLVPGLVQRRWGAAATVFLVGAVPPLAAGLLVRALGRTTSDGILPSQVFEDPWVKVLGSGVPMVVALVAAVVVVLGWLAPNRWRTCGVIGRRTSLAAVAVGGLIALAPLYGLAVSVMGTSAVAWRLTWILPLPALVGLLASLPRWSRVPVALPVTAATVIALVWGGMPLWSAGNSAWIAPPGAWKVYPADLEAARWVVAQEPSGRVLAPTQVSSAIGAVSAEVRPVGSRIDYMAAYLDFPGAGMTDRLVLQRLADGGTDPTDVAAAPTALDALGVEVVCAREGDAVLRDLLDDAYRPAFANATTSCFRK